jgi:predicted RNA-binding protein YlqC (UPF0109 family)
LTTGGVVLDTLEKIAMEVGWAEDVLRRSKIRRESESWTGAVPAAATAGSGSSTGAAGSAASASGPSAAGDTSPAETPDSASGAEACRELKETGHLGKRSRGGNERATKVARTQPPGVGVALPPGVAQPAAATTPPGPVGYSAAAAGLRTQRKVIECDRTNTGRVIGPGGETIRRLKQQSGGAAVSVDQTSMAVSEPHKVVIEGSEAQVLAATTLLNEILLQATTPASSAGGSEQQGSVIRTIELEGSKECGQLIGKQGATIGYIQSTSGCRVQIDVRPSDASLQRWRSRVRCVHNNTLTNFSMRVACPNCCSVTTSRSRS